MAKRTQKKAKPKLAQEVNHRDPEPAKTRHPRQYVEASPPTVCPDCGWRTVMNSGRRIIQIGQRVLEYRKCKNCGKLITAGRELTPGEIEEMYSKKR